MGDVVAIRSLVHFCVLLVLGRISLLSGESPTYKNVICYYNNIRPDVFTGVTNYSIADIDPSICTHLVYFYTDYLYSTIQTTAGIFTNSTEWEQMNNLRLSNPSLKIILSVGDYDQSLVKATYEERQTIFRHAIGVLRNWNFDGFDYLWSLAFSPALVVFLEEMHAAFATEATSNGEDPLILMLTVWGFSSHIDEGSVDLSRLSEAVDIFHTMMMFSGYSTPYQSETGLESPLYGNGTNYLDDNVSKSIRYYLDAGMMPDKLHMEVWLHAISFTLSDPQLTGVGAPTQGPGEPGEYTKLAGRLSSYEVCERLQEESYTSEADPEGVVNFAYKDDQWITFEDQLSLKIKMAYVYEHNLGGVAVWFLNDDDYTGQFCNQGRYPLLSFLYKLASKCQSVMTALQPQTCPDSLDRFPDPYSCQHYRQCVYDMLFRVSCDPGLSYDAMLKECVQNPTTSCDCVIVPPTTK